jgi:DNA-binding NarL/FixJ family response regulator
LDAADDSDSLTARELEVLQAIARGMTNQAASEALGISVKTIDTHRTNLMRKLGVRSTATLLVRAMRDGLIDVSDLD